MYLNSFSRLFLTGLASMGLCIFWPFVKSIPKLIGCSAQSVYFLSAWYYMVAKKGHPPT